MSQMQEGQRKFRSRIIREFLSITALQCESYSDEPFYWIQKIYLLWMASIVWALIVLIVD
jgi:hypothetical protein